MKNIIINKEQEKYILESIDRSQRLGNISKKLISDINEDNTPISNLPISHSLNKKIIEDALLCGYNDAVDNFIDDITAVPLEKVINKLNKLIAICEKKEQNIHNELEKLCVDVVTGYFGQDSTLADVTIECRLVNDLSTNTFHIMPDNGNDVIDSVVDDTECDITHRKLCNILSMGGALKLYDDLQDKFVSELFKLDEELPHLYSKILKINNYLLYVNSQEITDKENRQSGCVNVTLGGEQGDKITAVGTLFPFMLIEALRGYFELKSDTTLPDDAEETDMILDNADILVDEPWYMILGVNLWNKLAKKEGIELSMLDILYRLDKPTFNILMSEVLAGTNTGEKNVEALLQRAQRDFDYSNFEKDLQKKREKNNLLTNSLS